MTRHGYRRCVRSHGRHDWKHNGVIHVEGPYGRDTPRREFTVYRCAWCSLGKDVRTDHRGKRHAHYYDRHSKARDAPPGVESAQTAHLTVRRGSDDWSYDVMLHPGDSSLVPKCGAWNAG